MNTLRMNPTVKREWITALRSGTYKQGRNRLRNDENGFCCLGVLCDLYDPTRWEQNERGGWRYRFDEHQALTALPNEKICEWAGIELGYKSSESEGMYRLTQANDGVNVESKTFAEIADIIEAEY